LTGTPTLIGMDHGSYPVAADGRPQRTEPDVKTARLAANRPRFLISLLPCVV
jgi:hypothetical protein